jgi:Cu/Ag efflux protein CusF
MRMLANVITAAALMGTASLAYAATATGQITNINPAKHVITLNTGSKFRVPARTDLSIFKVGEKVTVVYRGGNGLNMVTAIHSQAGPVVPIGGGLHRISP